MILHQIGEIQKNVEKIVLLLIFMTMIIYVWQNVHQKNHIIFLTINVKQNAQILTLNQCIIKMEVMNVYHNVLLENIYLIMYVIQVHVLLIQKLLQILTMMVFMNVLVNINIIKLQSDLKQY